MGDVLVVCERPALDLQYIDAELPPESPYLYGLHPNAEIGFLTQTSEKLFRTVLELQPRDSHGGDRAAATREEKVWGGGAEVTLGAEDCTRGLASWPCTAQIPLSTPSPQPVQP